MKKFKEMDKRKRMMIVFVISIILFIAIVLIYRSYAIYQESQDLNVIKGGVPNQDYDVFLSYYIVQEDGTKTFTETMPNGRSYQVDIECDKGATGEWNYENWGPLIYNMQQSRTKCKLLFSKPQNLFLHTIQTLPRVTSGSGLYEVSHNDASITYTNDVTAINNLKMTELRFVGVDPNNYVMFNNELWRMIGLVNTPEGQRIKIIRKKTFSGYSWDSSVSSINNGNGVNEWSSSDLMNLLNNGPYYNRTKGTCYTGQNNAVSVCDFSQNGLHDFAKDEIDTITWNVGSQGNVMNATLSPLQMYNHERSNVNGKFCSSGTNCNDAVVRTTTWKGRVGLMYPSDYGYATSGSVTMSRESCLSSSMFSWDGSEYTSCKGYNWLLYNGWMWTMTPATIFTRAEASAVFDIQSGKLNLNSASGGYLMLPTIYLKTDVKIILGDGTEENPYRICA